MELKFDIPKVKSSIIKVLGVGGGGGNAVNHMYNQGIKGVDFIVCNTDSQALELSPVPNKMQLGSNLTEGRGAGSNPDVGKKAAQESIEEIKKILATNTKMLFVTAGMGGGTGTGAAPVIASLAKDMGILTVGIVTTPFLFEGPKRKFRAGEGIAELGRSVDTLLVISNEKLKSMFGNLSLSDAFANADNILTGAAKGIAEIITVPGYINVDFEDVKSVMTNSGAAIMGSAMAEGEDRAKKAVEKAIHSPLLSDNDIKGAKYILLNISSGKKEVLMDEISTITDHIQQEVGDDVDMIWGNCLDETLDEKLSVTIIATGFDNKNKGDDPSKIRKKFSVTEPKKEKEETEKDEEVLMKVTRNENEQKDENLPGQTQIPFVNEESEEPVLKRRESNAQNHVHAEKFDEGRMKNINFRLKTIGGLAQLENEPAYVRKNVKFEKVPHSSEVEISRYTLSEDEDGKKVEVKKNNSFLHDNVD